MDPIFLAFFRLFLIIPILGLLSSSIPKIRKMLSKLSRRELLSAIVGESFGLGLGDLLYLTGLSLTQVNIAGPLSATMPIFSGILAAFLRERITWRVLGGIVLVVVGNGFAKPLIASRGLGRRLAHLSPSSVGLSRHPAS